MSLEAKRRYRERNREKLRAAGREYAARKRREAGMPALGTPESTENRRRARKASGEEHGNWRGDGVGYFALHAWVELNKKRTGACSKCGVIPDPVKGRKAATEWANVSGSYLRDLSDYTELCVPCHRRVDAPRGFQHGTSTGYDYYRCRCDACRAAGTARRRDYLRRKRAMA